MQYSHRIGLVFLVCCTTLSSCAWFIPPEKSAPRYNSVIGNPRIPVLNSMRGMMPAALVSEHTYPPVAPEKQFYTNAAIGTQVPQSVPVVAVPQSMPDKMLRQVPIENPPIATAMVQGYSAVPTGFVPNSALAQNAYPSLSTVPPSPAESDPGVSARMSGIRTQLEQDRAIADDDRARLQGDAAAEPSLVPPPEPVHVAPMSAPVQVAPVPAVTVPYHNAPLSSVAPLVPRPEIRSENTAPQPVVMTVPAVTVPQSIVSTVDAPTAASTEELVDMHSRAVSAAIPVAPATVPSVHVEAAASPQPVPTPLVGAFDPMADVVVSSDSGYAGNSYRNREYLPSSRYADQRGY